VFQAIIVKHQARFKLYGRKSRTKNELFWISWISFVAQS
jgi:hypothetical protein